MFEQRYGKGWKDQYPEPEPSVIGPSIVGVWWPIASLFAFRLVENWIFLGEKSAMRNCVCVCLSNDYTADKDELIVLSKNDTRVGRKVQMIVCKIGGNWNKWNKAPDQGMYEWQFLI